jgi:S-adenosylmethionine synthetase
MYIDRLGAIAHYNVDKALLIAGRVEPGLAAARSPGP